MLFIQLGRVIQSTLFACFFKINPTGLDNVLLLSEQRQNNTFCYGVVDRYFCIVDLSYAHFTLGL